MSQNATQFHSEIASQFSNNYQTSTAFIERYKVWINLLNKYIKPTDSILDVGCGSGIFSRYVAGICKTVLGVDGADNMINLCLATNVPLLSNLSYEQRMLPFQNSFTENKVFSAIISSSVLEYIDEDIVVIEQFYEMLTVGGVIIVSFPNASSIYRKIEKLVFRLSGKPEYYKHVKHLYTEEFISNIICSLGFEKKEVCYYASKDIISKYFKYILPQKYVTTLYVGVYCKVK
jgi:2-polyprenyl-3-methyl-5-hydroxy-6-metoxy-1,4-benzoquinol methylase